ncbi:hypothetical protein Q0P32_14520, partial [Staphylococcus aureus]|nr:hypothetical protein [Staphylococcus aureus]
NLRAVLNRFEGMLGMTIADEDASQVYLLLDDENGLEEFPEGGRRMIEVAVATVLFVGASGWIAGDAARIERLGSILDRSVRHDPG